MRSKTESKVMEVQGGFRRGRSCVDQIFTIRQLSEKVLEKNKQMVIACIDFGKGVCMIRCVETGYGRCWSVMAFREA